MRLRNVGFAVLAVMLFTGAANQRLQWLTKKGAKPYDRVLGRVSGGDFITCNRSTVKMSEIEGPVLSDSNSMSCPSNHGYSANVDGSGGDDPAGRERETIKRLMEKSKP